MIAETAAAARTAALRAPTGALGVTYRYRPAQLAWRWICRGRAARMVKQSTLCSLAEASAVRVALPPILRWKIGSKRGRGWLA